MDSHAVYLTDDAHSLSKYSRITLDEFDPGVTESDFIRVIRSTRANNINVLHAEVRVVGEPATQSLSDFIYIHDEKSAISIFGDFAAELWPRGSTLFSSQLLHCENTRQERQHR